MESIQLSDVPKMKVADLKKHLKDRSLPITGNKSELVLRLEEAVTGTADISQEEDDLLGDHVEDELLETASKPEGKPETTLPKEATPTPAVQTPTEVPAAQAKHKIEFKPTEALTDEERVAKRAEKFGIVNDDDAKVKRAARFGIVSDENKKTARAAKFGLPKDENKPPVTASPALDAETLAKRQARFGVVEAPTKQLKGGETSTANAELSEDEKAKILKRKERFGEITSPKVAKVEEDEKINKRKERFGSVAAAVVSADDEDKKKKRADRFQSA